MKTILLALLAACSSPHDDELYFLPDAAPDAPRAQADACVPWDAGPSCCDLLPDREAYHACVRPEVPPGHCADMVCRLPDCTYAHTHVCSAAVDAGVDAP